MPDESEERLTRQGDSQTTPACRTAHNIRASDQPVDVESVLSVLDVIEQADPGGPEREREASIYRRMVQVRHNASGVPVEQWDRAEVDRQEEVMASPAFADELIDASGPVDLADAVEVMSVIRSRRSCRSFADRPVPPDHLRLVLEAGRWAPSAGNAQPWELLVLQEPESKQLVADALAPAVGMLRGLDPTFPGFANPRYLVSAPVLVLVLGDVRAMAAYPYPLPRQARWAMFEQSLAMCIQNMWLLATRLGLAATNYSMGHPGSDRAIWEAFGVPDHFALPTMLVLGYPRRQQSPRPRRPLDELVHRERFDAARVRSDEALVDSFYASGVRGRGFR